MNLILVVVSLLSIVFSSSSTNAARVHLTATKFVVTNPKYGEKPNSDITKALANAWKDACASPSASIVIVPKGTYKLKEASLKGPCKAPIRLQVKGILQAPEDGSQLSKPDTWIEFGYLDHFTLAGGGTFDGQGHKAWLANDCNKNTKCSSIAINMRFNFVKNSLVKDVTSLNSKNFHVNIIGCEQLTFKHFTVIAPENSTNTDGIHIGDSNGVNIIDTNIKTGDDCISIGDGTKQLNVTNVTCGPGHGISIGSLGKYKNEDPVRGINIRNCTLSNTSNGVRIKTWPNSPSAGSASDIHFENIIMNNVSNAILIDQEYCPWNQCDKQAPSRIQISNVSFKNIRGTSSIPVAVKIACAKGLPCQKVEMSDIDLKYIGNQGSTTSQCFNVNPSITRVASTLACTMIH